jgi:hypothetical protein
MTEAYLRTMCSGSVYIYVTDWDEYSVVIDRIQFTSSIVPARASRDAGGMVGDGDTSLLHHGWRRRVAGTKVAVIAGHCEQPRPLRVPTNCPRR